MKYPCGLIRDLLPLYHDKVCGEESNQAVQEHLDECTVCKGYYDKMCESDAVEDLVYDAEEEQKKVAFLKKVKKKWSRNIIIIVIIAAVVAFLWPFIVMAIVGGLLMLDVAFSRVEEYTDITKYESYIGANAEGDFESKWNFEEDIFPETITDDMMVEDFKMVYYNPWDAQYLSYLTVQYNPQDYEAEVERLQTYESTDYLGNYSVTGPPEGYTLLAMEADDYAGFIYAFTDNKDTIIYVELIFCNYFYDLDYTKYIPEEYLLEGFDATQDNPYRNQMMNRDLNDVLEQYKEDLNLK